MRIIEMEIGTFFRSPRWSENAVAQLVEEPKAEHGLAMIHVHCRNPAHGRHSNMRSRMCNVREMETDEWVVLQCAPVWVTAGRVL